jgi:hypothetical protein
VSVVRFRPGPPYPPRSLTAAGFCFLERRLFLRLLESSPTVANLVGRRPLIQNPPPLPRQVIDKRRRQLHLPVRQLGSAFVHQAGAEIWHNRRYLLIPKVPQMPNSEPTRTTPQFDAEDLKELREEARTYLKLDLLYIVTCGSIIATLKFYDDPIIRFPKQTLIILAVFGLVCTLDLLIDRLAFVDSMAEKMDSQRRISIFFFSVIAFFQPFFHFLFIGLVGAAALGFSTGYTKHSVETEARATIQDAAEIFFFKNQRVPTSMEELISYFPFIQNLHKNLNDQPIRFEHKDEKYFSIRFSGLDNLIDTSDDLVISSKPILENLRSEVLDEKCRK